MQKNWTQGRIVQFSQEPCQTTPALTANQSVKLTRSTARSEAIYTVSSVNCSLYRRYAIIKVQDQEINFQVDTASDVNVISKDTCTLMGKPELRPPSLIAHSASGDRIPFLGQSHCTYKFNNSSAQGTFYVADIPSNLLGSEWVSKMGIYAIMDSLPRTDPGLPPPQ
ncbi:unnamed protein product [Heligmosomoides polygyrus]|uniref:Peptidase A2 domain-containing protein n=1 Tax=Heligmosomoides polygyrus TaxID=6339 RepID=A0A183FU43_HELPZ|nr:unnamed protein product [Heligmosomoides polygyrus]